MVLVYLFGPVTKVVYMMGPAYFLKRRDVPVGHIWKFDLERSKKTLDFGVKFNFSKFRMEPVMHDFLARTENQKKKSEQFQNN